MITIKAFSHLFVGVCYVLLYGILLWVVTIQTYTWTSNAWLALPIALVITFMWISCPNTSARESCWPSFFVRPDGVITGRLRLNMAGILISTVTTNEKLYDSTVAWRDRAMRGVFHSGVLVRDIRSDERTRL